MYFLMSPSNSPIDEYFRETITDHQIKGDAEFLWHQIGGLKNSEWNSV